MKEVFLCAFMDSWAVEHGQIANYSKRIPSLIGVEISCEGLGLAPETGQIMKDHPHACHLYSHYYALDHDQTFNLLDCPFLDPKTEVPEEWLIEDEE